MRYHQIINELVGVKQFANMNAQEVLDYIKNTMGSTNIQVLGQGSMGAALKIGSTVYKLWQQDSAFTDFVKYAKANSNNPYLPKFFTDVKRMPAFFIRHEDSGDYVNYVRMEELAPLGDLLSGSFPLKMEYQDAEDEDERGHLGRVKITRVIEIINDLPDSVFQPLRQFQLKLNGMTGHEYKLDDFPNDLKLFVETLMEIKQLGHNLDLHPGNFMSRGGKQLVIMDPIANKEDLKLNRIFSKFNSDLKAKASEEAKQAMTSRVFRSGQ